MKKTHCLKLIDGTFSAADAENVISTLISSKINYHSIESFSNKERFNKDTAHNERRIEELKEAREYLDLIIKRAKQYNRNLVIESYINIGWE